MVIGNESFHPVDGEAVSAKDAREVLPGAELVYDDGASQQFLADGTTIYIESRGRTSGEWSVADDGSFLSYWPPSYRANYSLTWRVVDRVAVGLTFESQRDGSVFSGLFAATA